MRARVSRKCDPTPAHRPCPIPAAVHSKRQAELIFLQQTAGNAATSRFLSEISVQRQGDSENASGPDEPTQAMGAPPIISEDVQFDGEGSGEASSDTAVQALMEPVVQRQAQPQPTSVTPLQCPTVTFADFARRDQPGQFDANTAFTWSLRNRRFSVQFDRANSWVRPRSVNNMQLQRHEQYHLKLVCAIAAIANAMLARGDNQQTVTNQLRNTIRIHTQQYDNDTNHGTIAQQQASFEQAIDAGQVQMAPP